MCPCILYFLEGGKNNPLIPTINVFLFRRAWWAACNPSIWEVEVGEIQRFELSPSWLLSEFGVSLGVPEPIY